MSDNFDQSNANGNPNSGNDSDETSLGIEQNFAGLLTYAVGWLSGIVFLLIEKENSFVRFHAMQSVVVFVGLMILSIVAPLVPGVGGILGFIVWIGTLILWLFLMYRAYKGERYKLPLVGDFAEKQLQNKGSN
ncbi:MAG: DUF4870 domain-containing protein [Chloroflexi bacterium]|nr:DUF4870 domain-containing protein [Chloroflexota bacterium]